jgi:hypothetical protein
MPKAKPVKRILNVVPSRDTERDWRIQHADQAGLLDPLGHRRPIE